MKTFDNVIAKSSSGAARLFLSIAVAMLLLAGAAFMAHPAAAQQAGVPHAEVIKALGDRYAEESVGLGIAQNGGVIELFTSKDGATWTIVLTMPNGLSRVIATGESWMQITPLVGQLS
jgi:hypothetical protein